MTVISAAVPMTADLFREVTGKPLEDFAHQCHAASLALVQSGIWPAARVARGSALGVPGQHSWVALGDPYNRRVAIMDPTLWSYLDSPPMVVPRRGITDGYRPHGAGSIFAAGMPTSTGGEPIELTPTIPLSTQARAFLALLGPLDMRGWMALANSPVGGWPSPEIIAAMDDTLDLAALVPIDILGMLTDRNPSGLYLPGGEPAEVSFPEAWKAAEPELGQA